jgi:hypothetical protein
VTKPGNRKQLQIRLWAHASEFWREGDQGSFIHISDSVSRKPGPVINDGQKAPLPVLLSGAARASLIVSLLIAVHPAIARAQARVPETGSDALFRQPNAPIERRVEDLLSRMTGKSEAGS